MLLDNGPAALVQVGKGYLLLRSEEHDLLHLLGELLERPLDVEPEVRAEAGEHLEVELVAAVPAADRARGERKLRMRYDSLRVEELDRAEAVAPGARAHRVVERKEPRLELGQRVAAHRAGELGREDVLLAGVRLDRDRAAVGVAERGLERLGEALLLVVSHFQPIDHHLDRVLGRAAELRQRVDLVHDAVDAQPREPLRTQLLQEVGLLALAARDHRREDHELRVRRQRGDVVDHLRDRLRLERERVIGAIGRPHAREEEPQIVVDLGDRPDGRARVVARRLLLDRDRRRQPLDQVDVGLLHQLEELARIRRQRLDVAALALRVKRVERERRLPRAGEPGDDDQAIAREIEIEVLEVVRARTADADGFHAREVQEMG